MNSWIIAIIVICVIFVSAIIIIVFKNNNHIKKLEQIANDNYKKGKDEVTEILKNTIDKIADDRVKFDSMSEKELMVETMITLGSYGRRLDRIEDNIANYRKYIDEMNIKAEVLSNCYDVFLDAIKNSDDIVRSFNGSIQNTNIGVSKLNENLENMGNTTQKVSRKLDELTLMLETLNDVKDKVSKIMKDMNEAVSTYEDSPMTVLKNIESYIAKVLDEICEVNSTIYNLNDINTYDIENSLTSVLDNSDLCNIYDKVDSLENELNDIKYAIDQISGR